MNATGYFVSEDEPWSDSIRVLVRLRLQLGKPPLQKRENALIYPSWIYAANAVSRDIRCKTRRVRRRVSCHSFTEENGFE